MLKSTLFFVFILFCFFSLEVDAQTDQKYKVGYKEKGKASYYGEKLHGKVTASGETFDMFSMTAAHRELPFNSIIKVTNLNDTGKWVTLRVNDRGPFSKNRILDISKRAALKLNMEKTGVLEVEIEVLKVGDNKTLNTLVAQQKDSLQTKGEKDKNNNKTKVAIEKPKQQKKVAAKPKTKKVWTSAKLPLNKRFEKVGIYNKWGTPINKKGYGIQLASYADVEQAIEVTNEANDLGLSDVNIESGWSNGQHSYRVIWGGWTDKESALDNVAIAVKKGFPSAFVKAHMGKTSEPQKTGRD